MGCLQLHAAASSEAQPNHCHSGDESSRKSAYAIAKIKGSYVKIIMISIENNNSEKEPHDEKDGGRTRPQNIHSS